MSTRTTRYSIGGSLTSQLSNTKVNSSPLFTIGKVLGIVMDENTPNNSLFESAGGWRGIGTIYYVNYPSNKNISNVDLSKLNRAIPFLPNQNYTDNKLLGYGNLQLNGLDYYVVDGTAASILKVSFHHALGAVSIKNRFIPNRIPIIKYQFWLKAFTNLGYVYSEKPVNGNRLANTLLRTAGLGMDIVGIYDFVLKIDYSLNQLGDKGLYLRAGINF